MSTLFCQVFLFKFQGYNDQAISLLEREMQVHFSDAALLKKDTSERAKLRKQVYAQVT